MTPDQKPERYVKASDLEELRKAIIEYGVSTFGLGRIQVLIAEAVELPAPVSDERRMEMKDYIARQFDCLDDPPCLKCYSKAQEIVNKLLPKPDAPGREK